MQRKWWNVVGGIGAAVVMAGPIISVNVACCAAYTCEQVCSQAGSWWVKAMVYGCWC